MLEVGTYHQLWEHGVQLVIAGDGQRRLHGLQGEVLPQTVGDLWVVTALEAAEEEGHAVPSAPAFPWRHGCFRVGAQGMMGMRECWSSPRWELRLGHSALQENTKRNFCQDMRSFLRTKTFISLDKVQATTRWSNSSASSKTPNQDVSAERLP